VAVGAAQISLESGIAPALDALIADERHLFLRRAWYAGAGGEAAATLVARRPGGRVIAALPTVDSGPSLLRLRAVPGCYWPFRSFPAAGASDADLAALLSAPDSVKALGWAWRLGPVPEDDPTLARLRRVAPACGFTVLTRAAGTSYALDVAEARKAGTWPKPSTLKNIAKHEKRLARLGEPSFHEVRGDGWTAAAFDALAAVERNAWAGSRAGADPKFVDPAMRRRWEVAAADPAIANMLTAGILSVGGEPVAFSFGLESGRTRYCIATSYDGRFPRHSLGYLACYKTYIAAVDRGIERLSLGVGDGGEKSSMGAAPEGDMVDCLFVRGRLLASALRLLWR
jgi:CelD/BcsL family acetyltransferase involved in cellulose biosynthesis